MNRRTFVAALACLVVGPHEPIAGRKTYLFRLAGCTIPKGAKIGTAFKRDSIATYYYDLGQFKLPTRSDNPYLVDRTIAISRSA